MQLDFGDLSSLSKNFFSKIFKLISYGNSVTYNWDGTSHKKLDLGHVTKLHPTSSTHLRRKRVRLQIPQMSETAQKKEKKSADIEQKNKIFLLMYIHISW